MARNNERYKRLIKSSFACVILGIEIILYYVFWIEYYNKLMKFPFYRKGLWLIAVIYGVLLLFFNKAYGGLKIGYLRRGHVIYSHTMSLIIANILGYFEFAVADKKFHSPFGFVLLTAIDFIFIVIWVFLFQSIYSKIFPPRTLLVVYGEKPVFSIMEKINSREDKYIITGAININKGMDRIMEESVKYGGIIIGDITSHDRNILLKRSYEVGVRAYLVPKISDIMIRSASELNLFDTQLLLSRNDNIQIDQQIIKRAMDLILGSIMLIATSPLFLFFGVAIKLNDNGPIFYRQKRLTIDGKEFDILKFRTMIVNAEKDGVPRLAGERDNRITRIGKILRATRLDELPQLINILRGEMSIVGPRPERPEIAKEYEKEIPEFRYRLKMKAGLTGYAQVYGKYNTTPYDKLKLDLSYIRNYSAWLDLKLMLMTPKILFIKESTEGIDDDSLNALKKSENLKEEVYGKRNTFENDIELARADNRSKL